MAALLKSFLRGLMYLFVLPILLVVLSVYSIVGVIIFIYITIKGAFLYFTGRNIFGDLPEDVRARNILNGHPELNDPIPVTPVTPPVEEEKEEKKEEAPTPFMSAYTAFPPLVYPDDNKKDDNEEKKEGADEPAPIEKVNMGGEE